jgi:HEAT repeat protein
LAVANWIGSIGTSPIVYETLTGTAKNNEPQGLRGQAKAGDQAEGAGNNKSQGKGRIDVGDEPRSGSALDIAHMKGRAGTPLVFIPELVQLIHDKDAQVRIAALQALGKVNPAPDLLEKELRPFFRSGISAGERRAAADALLHLMREVIRKKTLTGLGTTASPEEIVALGQRVVPLARLGLADTDTEVRRSSAGAIDQAGLSLVNLFPPLNQPVGSRDNGTVRMTQPLVQVLARQGKSLALHLRNDGDATVRLLACQALANMAQARRRLLRLQSATTDTLADGLEPALKVLSRGIDDPVYRVRLASLDILESLETKAAPAANALAGSLADQNKFVRWEAARILGKIGKTEPNAVAGLARMLGDDSDLDLRKEAAETLAIYGPKGRRAAPALLAAMRSDDDDLLLRVMRALSSIGKNALGRDFPRAVDALVRALRDPDPRVRQVAAETLGGFGNAANRAAGALQRALKDENTDVRRAAGEALINIEQAEQ